MFIFYADFLFIMRGVYRRFDYKLFVVFSGLGSPRAFKIHWKNLPFGHFCQSLRNSFLNIFIQLHKSNTRCKIKANRLTRTSIKNALILIQIFLFSINFDQKSFTSLKKILLPFLEGSNWRTIQRVTAGDPLLRSLKRLILSITSKRSRTVK